LSFNRSTNSGFPHGELIRLKESLQRGELDKDTYNKFLVNKIELCVSAQLGAGVEIVADALFEWDDVFSPFCSGSVTGLKRGGLMRFFDNNAYYRRPNVTSKLEFKNSSTKPLFQKTLAFVDNSRFKAFLPGPFTFAMLCENSFYDSFKTLVADFSTVLKCELEELLSLGVKFVEVNDPALAQITNTKMDEVLKHYGEFVLGAEDKLWFTLPFSTPNARIVESLWRLGPVTVSLDLSSTTLHNGANVNDPEGWLVSAINSLNRLNGLVKDNSVDLGLVDARNTLLENHASITKILEVASKLKPRKIYVSNNASFDFLPETVAYDKVKIIGSTSPKVVNPVL
jgi:5-methyltetrahydropteroyltriglutamate--homocysteine methyltransferase